MLKRKSLAIACLALAIFGTYADADVVIDSYSSSAAVPSGSGYGSDAVSNPVGTQSSTHQAGEIFFEDDKDDPSAPELEYNCFLYGVYDWSVNSSAIQASTYSNALIDVDEADDSMDVDVTITFHVTVASSFSLNVANSLWSNAAGGDGYAFYIMEAVLSGPSGDIAGLSLGGGGADDGYGDATMWSPQTGTLLPNTTYTIHTHSYSYAYSFALAESYAELSLSVTPQ